jgi:periplasmic protein TonB
VSGFRLPLALSLAAHATVCAALLLLPTPAPPIIRTPDSGGIEVTFAPALPQPEALPAPPVKAETPPPQPMPPSPEPTAIVPPPPAIEPPPPAPEAAAIVPEAPPLPPPKPPVPPLRRAVVPPLRRAVVQHMEWPRPTFAAAPPLPAAPVAPLQTALASTPVPAPSTQISPAYGPAVSAWLNSHKHYPESARMRDEEGSVVLTFEVERSGRVVHYAIVKGSGYPDLDQAVDEMMRGATLPPFPATMTQSRITFSPVTLHFLLE